MSDVLSGEWLHDRHDFTPAKTPNLRTATAIRTSLPLKLQPRILMPASGANTHVRTPRRRIQVGATHAQERGLSPGVLEKGIVAPIIEHPQAEKKKGNEHAENGCERDEIHADTKDQPRRKSSPP